MTFCPQPKPSTPYALERHDRKTKRKQADNDVKQAAKFRDGNRCRWPHCEYRHIPQVIDAAHVLQAAGMGGDPLLIRTTRDALMAICRLHHRTGVQSLHSTDLRVEPMTGEGTDGPCQFLRRDVSGQWYVVAEEVAVGIYRRD